MLAKRIIPCLDIKDGLVVKGQQFENVQVIADPLSVAKYYSDMGADELVFYDIMASTEDRGPFLALISDIASTITIPFTVGGGVKTVDDFDQLLKSGADKVSINTQAFINPSLIKEASTRYGAQCVVLSVDVKRVENRFIVFTHGGRTNTNRDALDWIQEGVALGAGELCINSIDSDGSKKGFDLEFLNLISAVVNVPIIASGGAGSAEDFKELFTKTSISAGLAASIFHTKQVSITEVKLLLMDSNIPIRPFMKFPLEGTLIPAVVQDASTGAVLMLAYVNEEALDLSLKLGWAHFYSRSRNQLWLKGETSGNKLKLVDVRLDCDDDTLLMSVEPLGPTCHTGSYSCFSTPKPTQICENVFDQVMNTVLSRKETPLENSYTNYLLTKGIDKILKKVGEETAEVIIGAKNSKEELVYELADLYYHTFVLLASQDIPLSDIENELKKRFKD